MSVRDSVDIVRDVLDEIIASDSEPERARLFEVYLANVVKEHGALSEELVRHCVRALIASMDRPSVNRALANGLTTVASAIGDSSRRFLLGELFNGAVAFVSHEAMSALLVAIAPDERAFDRIVRFSTGDQKTRVGVVFALETLACTATSDEIQRHALETLQSLSEDTDTRVRFYAEKCWRAAVRQIAAKRDEVASHQREVTKILDEILQFGWAQARGLHLHISQLSHEGGLTDDLLAKCVAAINFVSSRPMRATVLLESLIDVAPRLSAAQTTYLLAQLTENPRVRALDAGIELIQLLCPNGTSIASR